MKLRYYFLDLPQIITYISFAKIISFAKKSWSPYPDKIIIYLALWNYIIHNERCTGPRPGKTGIRMPQWVVSTILTYLPKRFWHLIRPKCLPLLEWVAEVNYCFQMYNFKSYHILINDYYLRFVLRKLWMKL